MFTNSHYCKENNGLYVDISSIRRLNCDYMIVTKDYNTSFFHFPSLLIRAFVTWLCATACRRKTQICTIG